MPSPVKRTKATPSSRAPKPSREESPKREAILEAALALFCERGFHGTAVPLIAERAKVGAGTVYRYFDSKEAVVNALFRQWKQAFGGALLQDLPADAPPRQVFKHLWKRMGAFARKHPAALAFLELHHHASYLDAESRALETAMRAPFITFIRELQRTQVIKDAPPEMLIALILGSAAGLLKESQAGNFQLNEKTMETAEQCLWEAIRR